MRCRETKSSLDPICEWADLITENSTAGEASSSKSKAKKAKAWVVEVIQKPGGKGNKKKKVPSLQKRLFGGSQPLVQVDGHSCGVLVCWYIRQILRGEHLGTFPKDSEGNLLVPKVRRHLVIELLLALQVEEESK